MPRKRKATQGRKNAATCTNGNKDTVTLPNSSYRPTKAEMEQEHSLFENTGTVPEDWGDTLEEQLGNMTRFTFRQVNVRREGR